MDDPEFESANWDGDEKSSTPEISPKCFRGSLADQEALSKITFKVHWNESSYPAWTGLFQHEDAAEYGRVSSPSRSFRRNSPPLSTCTIAAIVDIVRNALGFQFDSSVSVFEMIMSQLDSRASRSCPESTLRTLHADYISGPQANFRKWYFASQMDILDSESNNYHEENADKTTGLSEYGTLSGDCPQAGGATMRNCKKRFGAMREAVEQLSPETIPLAEAESNWNLSHELATDHSRVADILIYLFCWTEANQARFMPELLAFIVKCARDHFHSLFPHIPSYLDGHANMAGEGLPQDFFVDQIIGPIYACYRSHNFYKVSNNGPWVHRQDDHKDLIGYDDMNQLFWYSESIKKLRCKRGGNLDHSPGGASECLIHLPLKDWFQNLAHVDWDRTFFKTYRESRSWLHSLTNFSRIWIFHISVFWFYTAFNVPSLYTAGYNYTNPRPPKVFVRLTIMSIGGLIGPVVTLLALLGEARFVPRNYPGAQPILRRVIAVSFMFLLLGVAISCNLALNPWNVSDLDLMPATVISCVLFSLAVIYTIYFSFQPLAAIFGSVGTTFTPRETAEIPRRYLANKFFTAEFAQRSWNGAAISWLIILLVFSAKFTESYFFLTLSIREPIRELGIMSLEDQCKDNASILYSSVYRFYPHVVLFSMIVTELTLFLLDTYLWYVIFNMAISVALAFKEGIFAWSPWRNIYSRLPHRINAKLLATGMSLNSCTALCIIWNSIIEDMLRSHILLPEQAARLLLPNQTAGEPQLFTAEEDKRSLKDNHAKSSAYRRLSFFAQSLSTPMPLAASIHEMPAFTVLIPHYKEDIMLNLGETISTGSSTKITVLEYLQRLYPDEWECFVRDIQNQSAEASSRSLKFPFPSYRTNGQGNRTQYVASRVTATHDIAIRKLGFSTSDPNDTDKTRLWCSLRTQTLYRTILGFSNYSKAIQIIHCAERSCVESSALDQPWDDPDDTLRVQSLCARKFNLLVAMQLYSEFTAKQLLEVETLWSKVPELVISFVEHNARDDAFYTCLVDNTCPVLESGRRQPRLRIKLSGNPFLGDGKSDNQNNALPFYRGEYIQLVDANQDNYLEECLKIRNVLMEFETSSMGSSIPDMSLLSLSRSMRFSARAQEDTYKFQDVEANGVCFNETDGSSFVSELTQGPASPVAIVGAREYIFSESIGVLGDVAAGKEQTFGTLFSRTLGKVGAKLHYGHPDFVNAIFMTTRGGVSKGQKGLHLNEDIYAGMAAVMRGGKIKHSEYFQCGKGRDLGFVSILNFIAKIGGGMGEQMLSREYFYMGTQLPFDRFVSFYYGHPGFHLNNVFIIMSLDMLMMVIYWISSIASKSTVCERSKNEPFTSPHHPDGCTNVLPLVEWVVRCVISIIVVFFVSLCPLFFQVLTEKGFFQSMVRIARHLASLSMLFEVFVCRVYARSFWEDMSLGGAKYIGTGRGMATRRLSFTSLYMRYSPELHCGLKGCMQLFIASLVLWNSSYMWFWVTSLSLCMSPFLYNPHQFAFTEFFDDYRSLLAWFWNSATIDTIGNSWSQFNQGSRVRLKGRCGGSGPSSDGSKPTLTNLVISQICKSLLTAACFIIPYIYVGTIPANLDQSGRNILVIMLLFAAVPFTITLATTLVCLFLSIGFYLSGMVNYANVMAMSTHVSFALSLVVSWWIIYLLEGRVLSSALFGIAAVCSSQDLIQKVVTVVLWYTQRGHYTNLLWPGDWRNAGLGWKMPLMAVQQIFEKAIIESPQYTYDFLTCHAILFMQLPFLLIPYIDRVHTLFLMWLAPEAISKARKAAALGQKKLLKVARCYCALFVSIQFILCLLVFLPFILPGPLMIKLEDTLRQYTLL